MSRIAKWDGSNWSRPGNAIFDKEVLALPAIGGNIYVGEDGIDYVLIWDGSTWGSLVSGPLRSGAVHALTVGGGRLYIAAHYSTREIGGSSYYVTESDGSNRLPLGTGLDAPVYAIAVSGHDLYVGGAFIRIGGVTANGIARWDGSSWSTLGTGLNDYVHALAASGDTVCAAGEFTTAGGVAANHIAKWDGENWSGLGSGLGAPIPGWEGTWVKALAIVDRDVYAGGGFLTAGGRVSAYFGRWGGFWDRACDISGDGRVDEEDLILLQRDWHAAPYSSK